MAQVGPGDDESVRIAGDLGSWDMVGRQIGFDLAERAKVKRRS